MPSADQLDPLHYGTISMSSSDIPCLRSGDTILSELERQVRAKENVSGVMKASAEVMQFCETIFPEVVEVNQIGKQDVTGITPNNVVTIEEDAEKHGNDANSEETGADVYVGGPAALCAAAIQGKSKQGQGVLYAHDGQRGLSNWKGSASHFHIRDAFPVYYWPDNHGLYCIYVTLKHAIQRRLFPKKYLDDVKVNPNWNKVRLSYTGVLKDLPLLRLFAENTLHSLRDCGLHVRGSRLSSPEDTTAYITTHHSHLTHDITQKLASNTPLMLKSMDKARVLHLELGETHSADPTEINDVFKRVSEDVGPWLETIPVTLDELQERGYSTQFVKQGFEFPRDGYFLPNVGEDLEDIIVEGGGKVQSNLRLKKILYKTFESEDESIATRVVWEDTRTGKIVTTKVKSLCFSLGPTATLQFADKKSKSAADVYQKVMKAAGSSIIYMVKVDKSVVAESTLTKFRDHIGSHNKHFVRLGEKEVIIDGKPFQFFLQQGTGGGHFPSEEAHAETALNVFKANAIPLFGLNNPGFEYDIITVRSCARSVTASNAFRIVTPLANVVGVYGIGGIGMTTMFPNGLLMLALMKLRGKVARGEITNAEFKDRVAKSEFGSIPHWEGPNPFARNYTRFIDSPSSANVSILVRHGSFFKKLLRFVR